LTQEFLAAYRDDYYAHGYLGDIYLQMGDLAHAEEEYSGSYELCPSEDTRKHLEAVRKQKQSEASSRNKRNQSLAIVMTRFDVMKQFLVFATLATVYPPWRGRGDSAPSR
jgi:hypothetical protein